MRFALAAACLALAVSPAVQAQEDDAGAKTRCTIEIGASDRVVRSQDLVVEAGTIIDNAVAVEGNVVVRRGASVKNAVAVNGYVRVEAGGIVRDTAVAAGGELKIASGAKVKNRVSLGKDIRVQADDGKDKVRINISVDGLDTEAMVRKLIGHAVEELKRCEVKVK